MWGAIVGIGALIWGLFSAAVDAVVAALVIAVEILQTAVILLWNGIKIAGVALMSGFLKVWNFFRPLYEDVLKPAWVKFWGWFDTARKWLNDTFGPVLQFLRDTRDLLLCFWKTYVQPWLDLIDVTRKGLKVLASLGLKWAAALDAELAKLEEKIQAPFLYLLGKLNEVINTVNLVIGADGLFQRLTMLRSLAKSYQGAWGAIAGPFQAPVSDDTKEQIWRGIAARTLDDVDHDYQQWLRDGTGNLSKAVDSALALFRARTGRS